MSGPDSIPARPDPAGAPFQHFSDSMFNSYVYSLFETCSMAGTNANPYGIQNEESQDHPDILLCRHLRQPWEQFWKNFHYFG